MMNETEIKRDFAFDPKSGAFIRVREKKKSPGEIRMDKMSERILHLEGQVSQIYEDLSKVLKILTGKEIHDGK